MFSKGGTIYVPHIVPGYGPYGYEPIDGVAQTVDAVLASVVDMPMPAKRTRRSLRQLVGAR